MLSFLIIGPPLMLLNILHLSVYGVHPLTPLDLIPIPNESKVSFEAREMKRLHEQIRNQIEKTNEAIQDKGKQAQEGT